MDAVVTRKDGPALGRLDRNGPLTEDERLLRSAARAPAGDRLQPRGISACRGETARMTSMR